MPVPPAADPLAALEELPGVSDAATEAREAVDRLLAHRILRQRSAEVAAESALRAGRASAALEGIDLRLEVWRAGAGFDAPDAGPARGALRVSAEVGSLVDVWRRAPLQALARLHVLAAADLLPADLVGRPRPNGVDVEDPLRLGRAPGSDEAAARTTAVAEVAAAGGRSPAVLAAAVVHGELLAVRPFAAGNGLVARAASRLVLVARGLDPQALSVPEVGHVELGRTAYAVAARQYVSGTPDGVAAWVVHCCEAVSLGAREGLAVCESMLRGA